MNDKPKEVPPKLKGESKSVKYYHQNPEKYALHRQKCKDNYKKKQEEIQALKDQLTRIQSIIKNT